MANQLSGTRRPATAARHGSEKLRSRANCSAIAQGASRVENDSDGGRRSIEDSGSRAMNPDYLVPRGASRKDRRIHRSGKPSAEPKESEAGIVAEMAIDGGNVAAGEGR